jgi:hypothetical protein
MGIPVDIMPNQTTEPEGYDYDVYLQGTGATAPTVINGKSLTVTRTSQGVIKLTFNLDPGPLFLGGSFGFGDATATNILGWTVCFGAYTKPAAGAKAFMTVTIGNGSNAATDLLATSNVKLALRFKLASTRI